MIKYIFYLFVATFSFYSCSSSVEETRNEEVNNEEDENYVFDEVPVTEEASEEYFLVQIGAFTTKNRADDFVEESKIKIKDELSVSYEPEINLFVVRLDKKFSTKKEAEEVRDTLKKIEDFKDAWIVSSTK